MNFKRWIHNIKAQYQNIKLNMRNKRNYKLGYYEWIDGPSSQEPLTPQLGAILNRIIELEERLEFVEIQKSKLEDTVKDLHLMTDILSGEIDIDLNNVFQIVKRQYSGSYFLYTSCDSYVENIGDNNEN